ncbi:MAG: 4-coumarate--CoA ligase [Candidatus Competibacterales bacterium]
MPALLPQDNPWWRDGALLQRFVADFIAGTLQRLRPGGPPPPPTAHWQADFDLVASLGLDSIERFTLLASLDEVLHLVPTDTAPNPLVEPTLAAWLAFYKASLEGYPPTTMTFFTSGSIASAKRCTHTLDDLQGEVAVLAGLLAPVERVVAGVPCHHIYGFLFTVLLPRALGAAVWHPPLGTPASLGDLLRPGDLVVAQPLWWAAAARNPGRWPPNCRGVTSAALCPSSLFAILHAQGLTQLVDIYGATETAGVGWRQRGTDPFELLPHWRWGPGATLVRQGKDGPRRVSPADRLALIDQRRFWVVERADGVVQVAGVNVDLAAVAALLQSHPGVADARVRPMAPPEGERLKAFVVPHLPNADLHALETALRQWCAQHLTPPQRPQSFTFGPSLPRNALGKDQDWPLASPPSPPPPGQQREDQPR